MVEAGANINRQSSLGITPLIDAAAAMNMDMLEYLMEAGAKLHLQERDGWTAADHLEHNIEKLEDQLHDENAERAQLVLQKMRESLQKLDSTGHNLNLVKKKTVSTVFVTEDDPERGESTCTYHNICIFCNLIELCVFIFNSSIFRFP